MDVASADCGYGVDRARGEGVLFDRQNELGGGTESIFAVGHQERSGVAAEARDGEAIAGRGGDAGDDADGNAFAFEQRALLDVQLDPGVVAVRRKAHGSELSCETCCDANGAQRNFVLVLQRVGAVWVERAGQQTAAQTADAEAGGLFGGEHDEFDGAPRVKAAAFERAERLQAAQNADCAVVHSGVRDGVGVGAGGYCG